MRRRYLRKRNAYMNEPDIYFLGLRGRRYIASLGQYSREQVDRIAGVSGGSSKAPFLMMNHDLMLSTLYVNARLECERYGWEMGWKNTRMMEMERMGIEPDAWIEVVNGDRSREAFIEFTAVVPTKRDLSARLEGYEEYWERTGKPVPVLWLTTTSSKLGRLCDAIMQATYSDFFLVGLIQDAEQFVTKRIWWWSEKNDKIRWIETQ